jgi:histone H4
MYNRRIYDTYTNTNMQAAGIIYADKIDDSGHTEYRGQAALDAIATIGAVHRKGTGTPKQMEELRRITGTQKKRMAAYKAKVAHKSVKRSTQVTREITKHAIRRLARRGGVKRISGVLYQEARGIIEDFVKKLKTDAVAYTEHAKRSTVTALDVINALRRQGKHLYGYT